METKYQLTTFSNIVRPQEQPTLLTPGHFSSPPRDSKSSIGSEPLEQRSNLSKNLFPSPVESVSTSGVQNSSNRAISSPLPLVQFAASQSSRIPSSGKQYNITPPSSPSKTVQNLPLSPGVFVHTSNSFHSELYRASGSSSPPPGPVLSAHQNVYPGVYLSGDSSISFQSYNLGQAFVSMSPSSSPTQSPSSSPPRTSSPGSPLTQQRWAGGGYTRSPAPSSLPLPSFRNQEVGVY